MPESMDIAEFAKLYGGETNLGKCKSAELKKPKAAQPEQVTSQIDDRGLLPDNRYDSKAERVRHTQLLAMQQVGEITHVMFHPLSLRLGFTDKGRPSRYTPDFFYHEVKTGKNILEECKGFRRRDWPVRSAFVKSVWGTVFELRTVQV